jgi:divalent metal cation (Fe/Co/Zn/Cd) transporter
LTPDRKRALARALRLEYLSVGWNVAEAAVSIAAAIGAGSVALFGFGADSVVESASAGILVWRLHAERQARDREEIEALDRRARKLVGLSLFLLVVWVAADAAWTLIKQEKPQPTKVGMAVTALSLVVMLWLARAKRRAAAALESRALEADSFQTTACWWLSLIVLCGIGLNAVFGWWWADPVAALAICVPIVYEGREAWRGEDGCADCGPVSASQSEE